MIVSVRVRGVVVAVMVFTNSKVRAFKRLTRRDQRFFAAFDFLPRFLEVADFFAPPGDDGFG